MNTRNPLMKYEQQLKKCAIAVLFGLAATLAACSGSKDELKDRTYDGCLNGACECVFTSECPSPLLCVDGLCRTEDVLGALLDAANGGDAGDVLSSNDGDPLGDGSGVDADVGAPRGMGVFCNNNNECESGFCLETAVGGYCSRLCDQGCPEDWICKTVVSVTDPISLCAQDTSRICLPCDSDRLCGDSGNNRCLSIGGGSFCSRDCSTEACPTGYVCEDVDSATAPSGRQCLPLNGTCDCDAGSEGQQKTCTSENAFGVCFGIATCDPDRGFVECTARAPLDELCNGLDDDCDGSVDEEQAPAPCERRSDLGTCEGVQTCQGALGLVCNAQDPVAEVCNDRDDDCDGEADEDFKLGGDVPATVEHCGVCGFDCNIRFANSAEVSCDVSTGTPACVLDACQTGYVLLGGACVDENATLCVPCGEDDDCFGTSSRCLSLSSTDPRTFCARDCSGDSETSTECPASFTCEAAVPSAQCIPDTASCDCTATNAGGQKACTRVGSRGVCFGLETCDPALGWQGCTAPEPTVEACDGVDNDCNGQVDEGVSVGADCQQHNEFGTCTGLTFCGGTLGPRCSAAVPAAESCNGRDDDCNGVADDGFAIDVGGALVYSISVQHCGACNYACPTIAHGRVTCEGSGAAPRCAVGSCDEGYFPGPGNVTCIPVPRANQCAQCATDADCQGPRDRCIADAEGG